LAQLNGVSKKGGVFNWAFLIPGIKVNQKLSPLKEVGIFYPKEGWRAGPVWKGTVLIKFSFFQLAKGVRVINWFQHFFPSKYPIRNFLFQGLYWPGRGGGFPGFGGEERN